MTYSYDIDPVTGKGRTNYQLTENEIKWLELNPEKYGQRATDYKEQLKNQYEEVQERKNIELIESIISGNESSFNPSESVEQATEKFEKEIAYHYLKQNNLFTERLSLEVEVTIKIKELNVLGTCLFPDIDQVVSITHKSDPIFI